MTSYIMPSCKACSRPLPNCDQRRNLGGRSSKDVLALLRELLMVQHPVEIVHKVLPCDIKPSSSMFVCRDCFKVTKLEKLSKEIEAIRHDILQRLNSTYGSTELLNTVHAQSQTTPTGTKRPTTNNEIAGQSTPKRTPKHRKIGSQESRILHQTVVGDSPAVTVLLKRKKDSRVYPLTSSLKGLGRSVGQRNRNSIARQAVLDKRICKRVLVHLGNKLSGEMKAMCSLKTNSVLRMHDFMSIQQFHPEKVISEMQKVAPKTLSLLQSCLGRRKKSKATNCKWSGRTKNRIIDRDIVVALCCCVLLRGRNQRMNMLQRIVSLILYTGHASKKVYTRLQKLLFSMSHKRTIALVNELGKDHDSDVVKWKTNILAHMNGEVEVDKCNEELPPIVDVSPLVKDSEYSSQGGSLSSDHLLLSSDENSTSVSPPTVSTITDITSSSFTNPEAVNTPANECPSLLTYKLVGDNLDKTIKPRDMRIDHQTRSLHYFQTYAVRDRVDLTKFEDNPSLTDVSKINLDEILPTTYS